MFVREMPVKLFSFVLIKYNESCYDLWDCLELTERVFAYFSWFNYEMFERAGLSQRQS